MLEFREETNLTQWADLPDVSVHLDDRPRACYQPACETSSCPILKDVGKPHSYGKGDVIFWDGDRCDRLFLIVSGVVRCSKILRDGRRQIMRFAFPGEVLASPDRTRFQYSAEALMPVRVVTVPRLQFERAMHSSPCLRQLMMQALLDELDHARGQLLALGRLSATERVAQFLAAIAHQTGTDASGAFELPISRLDIADYLGLTIETVSRIISRLKRDGQVQLLGSSKVVIRDLEGFTDELLADAA